MLTLTQQDSVPLSPPSSPLGGFPGISRLCLLSTSAALPALTRRTPSSRLPGGSCQGQCDPALLGLKPHVLMTTTPAARKRQTGPRGPCARGPWGRGGLSAGFRGGGYVGAVVGRALGLGGSSAWSHCPELGHSVPRVLGSRGGCLSCCFLSSQPLSPQSPTRPCGLVPGDPAGLPRPGQSLWASPGARGACPRRTHSLGGPLPPHGTPVPRAPPGPRLAPTLTGALR